MTLEELFRLPIGATVELDDEVGQVTRSGTVVEIEWMDCTSTINTAKTVWESFVVYLKEVKS